MQNKSSIALVVLLPLAICPSYAITFSSGTAPVINGREYHWWIENDTPCPTDIKIWLSSTDDTSNKSDNSPYIKNANLNTKERMMVTLLDDQINTFTESWLNISQKSNTCHSTRLTRVKLKI